MKWMRTVLAGTALMLAFPCCALADMTKDEILSNGLKMGVMVYDPDDAQTLAYRDYLQNYLAEAFDAEFFYSDAVYTLEAEAEFIERLHENGIQAVIGNVSPETMELCEEYGIYYVYGSSTVSDEVFEEVKENPHFLGTVSASLDADANVSREMTAFFAEDEAKDSHGFVICTGGDTELHRVRATAMIETLSEIYGFTLETPAEELAVTEEILELDTGTDIKVTLIPGYPNITPLAENVKAALEQGGYDTVISVMSVNYIMDAILEAETAIGYDVRVGTIDCFTENTQEFFNTQDAFGNPQLNYLVGKYGAMIAPAFAAVGNAIAGNIDVVRDDGHAFRLYQDYWIASSAEEFDERYEKSISLYDNAYSAVDIMGVTKAFTPDMTFEDFRAFTER